MPRATDVILATSIGLLASIACGSGEQGGTQHTASTATGCPGFRAPVRREADSISPDRACSYVIDAFETLSRANSDSVVLSPADTNVISSATVDAIAQIDSAGGPVASWWLVTFHLAGKPYDAEVRLNQKTGERTIRPVHK